MEFDTEEIANINEKFHLLLNTVYQKDEKFTLGLIDGMALLLFEEASLSTSQDQLLETQKILTNSLSHKFFLFLMVIIIIIISPFFSFSLLYLFLIYFILIYTFNLTLILKNKNRFDSISICNINVLIKTCLIFKEKTSPRPFLHFAVQLCINILPFLGDKTIRPETVDGCQARAIASLLQLLFILLHSLGTEITELLNTIHQPSDVFIEIALLYLENEFGIISFN